MPPNNKLDVSLWSQFAMVDGVSVIHSLSAINSHLNFLSAQTINKPHMIREELNRMIHSSPLMRMEVLGIIIRALDYFKCVGLGQHVLE
jgi:hypothetical protein